MSNFFVFLIAATTVIGLSGTSKAGLWGETGKWETEIFAIAVSYLKPEEIIVSYDAIRNQNFKGNRLEKEEEVK
jgi:hypothetical protein